MKLACGGSLTAAPIYYINIAHASDTEKLRVLIPTTSGLVEVLLLTDEDPQWAVLSPASGHQRNG